VNTTAATELLRRLATTAIIIVAGAACGTPQQGAPVDDERATVQPAAPPAAADDPAATLQAYFAALGEGRYRDAIPLYGGSYEVLQGWNPDTDPADTVGLWASACGSNGLVCMPRSRVVRREPDAGDTIRFVVEFLDADGNVFVRGPCCGETEETMPSRREFDYDVLRRGDRFVVLDLPPYVP
jgi:hypothetical protein